MSIKLGIVATNLRLPRRLHERLQQCARGPGNSINREIVDRVAHSFAADRLPSADKVFSVMQIIARRWPETMADVHFRAAIEKCEEQILIR